MSTRHDELSRRYWNDEQLTDDELVELALGDEYQWHCEHNPELIEKFKLVNLPYLGEHGEFNGQNCTDECSGWNGIDHRCDCGNRRVSWVNDHGYWYGEAY